MNLVDDLDNLNDEDKETIIAAWEGQYEQTIATSLLPFLDRELVIKSLINRASGYWSGCAPVLFKLGIKLEAIHRASMSDMIDQMDSEDPVYNEAKEMSKGGIYHWADVECLIDGKWEKGKVPL